ncbi:hypothetical protein KQJ29_24930 [Enterococcus sp. S181_ASV_20]|nr:hypothetical protein [Enterococcus sp. S181_ASV_20]
MIIEDLENRSPNEIFLGVLYFKLSRLSQSSISFENQIEIAVRLDTLFVLSDILDDF